MRNLRMEIEKLKFRKTWEPPKWTSRLGDALCGANEDISRAFCVETLVNDKVPSFPPFTDSVWLDEHETWKSIKTANSYRI